MLNAARQAIARDMFHADTVPIIYSFVGRHGYCHHRFFANITIMDRNTPFSARLIESLYIDAMVLADEARSYFERDRHDDHNDESAFDQIEFSCESLRVTTRLMHAIAWLLNQKAYYAGDLSDDLLRHQNYRLGVTETSDPALLRRLPEEARNLIQASEQLIARLARIESSFDAHDRRPGPVMASAPAVLRQRERLLNEF